MPPHACALPAVRAQLFLVGANIANRFSLGPVFILLAMTAAIFTGLGKKKEVCGWGGVVCVGGCVWWVWAPAVPPAAHGCCIAVDMAAVVHSVQTLVLGAPLALTPHKHLPPCFPRTHTRAAGWPSPLGSWRTQGEASAYSIFNPGVQRLPGQLDADQIDDQIRRGHF
jgi:hypothetical protein